MYKIKNCLYHYFLCNSTKITTLQIFLRFYTPMVTIEKPHKRNRGPPQYHNIIVNYKVINAPTTDALSVGWITSPRYVLKTESFRPNSHFVQGITQLLTKDVHTYKPQLRKKTLIFVIPSSAYPAQLRNLDASTHGRTYVEVTLKTQPTVNRTIGCYHQISQYI